MGTIFEISGQCPTGYELGDWNTGEGECCCNPDNQPDEPTYDLEEPVLIPPIYEEPVLINSMEEPIPIYLMEEPIPINGNFSGYGEEPIVIGGEEPILIGGEEPIAIAMYEEPVLIPVKPAITGPPPTLPTIRHTNQLL